MADSPTNVAKGNRAKGKGGRPPVGTTTDRMTKLREELAKLEAEAQEAEDAKALIVGRAVIDAMKATPTFKIEVGKHLKERVKKARELAVISDLVGA